MALWTHQELQSVFHVNASRPWEANGVSIDSRTLQPGDLFIAIKGPLTDGHLHVKDAFLRGAVAAIVEHEVTDIDPSFSQIIVPDSFQALQSLALTARQRATETKIIGLTGSFGKTTSREALRHVLSLQGPTHATERNFNNHWGTPLSVARLDAHKRFAIFEMGMNHAGEIAPLSAIVQPHLSLITTIGDAHIGNLGSLEAIARAKAEIFAGMQAGGIAVLNRDNDQYAQLAMAAQAKDLKILSFGQDVKADSRLLHVEFKNNQLHIHADIAGCNVRFAMEVLGDHWASNMVGVLTCVYGLGLDVRQAAEGLINFKSLEGRGAITHIPYQDQQITIIDDTYNAGPQAMRAALQTLSRLQPSKKGRRIAVLGEMADLGEFMIAEHQALAQPILENNIDRVFLYGPFMKYLHDILPANLKGGIFDNIPELMTALQSELTGGDCILVKGAHGQRAYDGVMHQVVTTLKSAASYHSTQPSI